MSLKEGGSSGHGLDVFFMMFQELLRFKQTKMPLGAKYNKLPGTKLVN